MLKINNLKSMEIQVQKSETKTITETININSFNEFYAVCYNYCNNQIYLGGFINNKKIVWIQISVDGNYSPNIKISDVLTGGNEDLELEIRNAYKNFSKIKQIPKKEFFKLLKETKELLS